MTVEELLTLLQKFVAEGKGGYLLKCSELEYCKVNEEYFGIDDENKVLWV